ncbi:hypothetical protein IFM89_011990, partial [Coptis chinensis]
MFLHNNTVDRIGNIWVMWKDGLAVNLVNLSHQQITVQINQTLITFVHASSAYGRRRMLWDELNRINVGNLAWAIAGDFNVVTALSERKGGGLPCRVDVNEFVKFINDNALLDSTTLGYEFSYCNKRLGAARIMMEASKTKSSLVQDLWVAAVINTLIKIWKVRNKCTFEDADVIIHLMKKLILSSIGLA